MLEIACFNIASALAAVQVGADRIELCKDYATGGITPNVEDLQAIRIQSAKPINVMIRPKPGDFTYSDAEFEKMRSDILAFKPEASGFVFGILDERNNVDEARNRELVTLAAPLPCTFHRAFDQIPDMGKASEQLIDCGFKSILTSGGQPNAALGADRVAELQEKVGDKISFILGGGVRSTNVAALKDKTGVLWYHSAAITKPGESVDEDEVVKLQLALK